MNASEVQSIRRAAYQTVQEGKHVCSRYVSRPLQLHHVSNLAIDAVETANQGVPRGLHRFGTTWRCVLFRFHPVADMTNLWFRNYTNDKGKAVEEQLVNLRHHLAAQLVIMRKITDAEKMKLPFEDDYTTLVACTKELHEALQNMTKVVQETRVEAVAQVDKIGWDELLGRGEFYKLDGGSLFSRSGNQSPVGLGSLVGGVKEEEEESLLCIYFSAGW